MAASATYKTSDVAKAVGISPKVLNRNIGQNNMKLPGPKPGRGNQRRFSIAQIHEVAILNALLKLEITPAAATDIAHRATERLRPRHGKPSEINNTFLLTTSDGVCSIIGLEPDQDIAAFLKDATVVVNIGAILKTVNEKLSA